MPLRVRHTSAQQIPLTRQGRLLSDYRRMQDAALALTFTAALPVAECFL